MRSRLIRDTPPPRVSMHSDRHYLREGSSRSRKMLAITTLMIISILYVMFGFDRFKAHVIATSPAPHTPPPIAVTTTAVKAAQWATRIIAVGRSVGTAFTLLVLPAIYSYLAVEHNKPVAMGGADIAAATAH